MGAADAHQHTDSNRNHNGSDVVHGTLKAEIGFGESSSNPIIYTSDYNSETNKKGSPWGLPFRCFISLLLCLVHFQGLS